MNKQQLRAVKRAHLYLKFSLNAFRENDLHFHDWDAHQETIDELEDAFAFLTEEGSEQESEYGRIPFDPWNAPKGCIAIATEHDETSCKGCMFCDLNLATECCESQCLPIERPDGTQVRFVPIEAEVQRLVESGRVTEGVFLDGEPATAHKKPDGFWIVRNADGKGGDVEYSQAAVKSNLIHNKGRFVS